MLMTTLCILIGIFTLIYLFVKRKYTYWKIRKVPYAEPSLVLGNYGDFILQRRHQSYVSDGLCKQFPNEPYIGSFYGTEPALIVKDPELIKLITTKDFYYFNGREVSDFVHMEESTQTLFDVNGDQWRVLRQNLTPVFTSAKMKNMFHLIEKCAHEFESLVADETKICDLIDARALIARFTMACIMSCAFGIDSGTMEKNYKDSPFTKSGEAIFTKSRVLAAKVAVRSIWPNIFYGLGLQMFPIQVSGFFKKFIVSIFDARQNKPTARNDFIDFMMTFKNNSYLVGDSITNLKTGGDKKVQLPVTDQLLLSQVLIFFLAGFETSATTASYTLYELSKNPEAQKKVQDEIDAYLKKYNNKLTYDIVTELPYTFACIEEALRLYPVIVNLTREVVEGYTLPTGLHLDKGTRIHIPVYHMQRDPKFFPEPEVFRPERFYGEERRNIIPYSYLPFGEGARICIGMRFAKMQMLAGLVTILKKFNTKLADGTPKIPQFEAQSFIPTPEVLLKLKVTTREGWETRQFVKN